MRPLISYRCEGAGGGGWGRGSRGFRGNQSSPTDYKNGLWLPINCQWGEIITKPQGGGRNKENFTAKHVYGVRAHVSIVHFFASFYNKWLYHLIFYGKKLRIRAEGPNNESRTQILPFNCNWAAWPWTVDSRLPNDNLCFRIQRNWM